MVKSNPIPESIVVSVISKPLWDKSWDSDSVIGAEANPKVLDDYVIGDSSTQSEALYNHKAFFFDKSRDVLSIPISADKKTLEPSTKFAPEYNRWNGFYVFDLDTQNEIISKGTITHSDSDTRYYGINNARTAYVDDVLYTASQGYLKMNSFDNLNEINSIKLENTGKFVEYFAEETVSIEPMPEPEPVR